MGFSLGVFGVIIGYALVWTGKNNLTYRGGVSVWDALMGTYTAQGTAGGLTTVPQATPNLSGNTPQTGGGGRALYTL